MYKIGVFYILCSFIPYSANADDMIKKTGEAVTNIKATVLKGGISAEYEDGKVFQFSKKSIRSIKFRPVVWKPKKTAEAISKEKAEEERMKAEEAEKSRLADATQSGDEWEARPEEEHINPWGNAALGLIPGYSGLYRTKNYIGGGVFTAIEFAAILNAADVLSSKKDSHKVTRTDMFFLFFISDNSTPVGNSLIYQSMLLSSLRIVPYKGGVSGRETVSQADDASKSSRLVTEQRTLALGILGSVLLADAISSYFSADSWNEGTFKGEQTGSDFARPTKPGARLLRSFFLPGWGQIYGGNKIKGYGWMTGAIGILSYALLKEQQAKIAQKAYSYSSGGAIALVLDTITNDGTQTYLERLPKRYLVEETTLGQERKKMEDAVSSRNQAWTYYAVFLALNLVDSYFFSGKNASAHTDLMIVPDFSMQSALHITGTYKLEPRIGMTLKYSF